MSRVDDLKLLKKQIDEEIKELENGLIRGEWCKVEQKGNQWFLYIRKRVLWNKYAADNNQWQKYVSVAEAYTPEEIRDEIDNIVDQLEELKKKLGECI